MTVNHAPQIIGTAVLRDGTAVLRDNSVYIFVGGILLFGRKGVKGKGSAARSARSHDSRIPCACVTVSCRYSTVLYQYARRACVALSARRAVVVG